ncbi:MAG: LysE family translocator [Hyphomicrobiaceae bacterium]
MISWFPNPLVLPVGILIGILISAPIGPVNVICIQRAIERGPLGGLAAGAGAVIADALIALIASLGVGLVGGVIATYRDIIQMVGGIALIVFGFQIYARPAQMVAIGGGGLDLRGMAGLAYDLPKAFFLTMTNPGAVLGLFAIFGGVGTFVDVRTKMDAGALVVAIVAGCALWWVALSFLVGVMRHSISTRWLERINRGAAIVLFGFAAVLLGELVLQHAWAPWSPTGPPAPTLGMTHAERH